MSLLNEVYYKNLDVTKLSDEQLLKLSKELKKERDSRFQRFKDLEQ